jgi:hypothetical protein
VAEHVLQTDDADGFVVVINNPCTMNVRRDDL